MTAESRGWGGRAGDEEGSRRTPDPPPRDGQWTQLEPRNIQYSVCGFGFLILNYRDGESGVRLQGQRTPGGRARVVQPCPGICLLLRLGQEWRHSCTARVPSQQISSLLQPDAGAATSSQPWQQIFKVLVRPRLSGCCTQHLVSAHLTLLLPPAAVPGDGSQHLGNINPSRYGLKQNIEFKKFSKCLSMR